MRKDAIRKRLKAIAQTIAPYATRTFFYVEDRTSDPQGAEGKGTIRETGEQMSLEEWRARKPRAGDIEMLVRFVDEDPLTTITYANGTTKTVGIDVSKL